MSTHGITRDVVQPDKEFDIECIHCNQYGKSKQKGLALAAVSYMTNCNYNLCSLKELESELKMNGDEKTITITNGLMVIKFEIIIQTKQGPFFVHTSSAHEKLQVVQLEKAPK